MQIDDWALQGSGKISITGQDNMKGYDPKIPDGKHTEIHGWFKIEDAPRDGTEILAYIECENFDGYDVIRRAKTLPIPWIGVFDYEDANIKGWMPLPKPPKKRHFCGDPEIIHCYRDENGKLMLQTWNKFGRHFLMEVIACPFCGQKAGE